MLIRVIKPFLVRGQRQEPGTVVDLPDHVAREILWMGKAERAQEPPAEPPEAAPEVRAEPEAEPAPPPRRGRPRRFGS